MHRDSPGQREPDGRVSGKSSGTLSLAGPAPPHTSEGPQPQDAPSAPFLGKLHRVLSRVEHARYIAWNASGDTLVIKDSIGLASNVLPVVWSHSNINSLFRQLNAYGFQRTTPPAMDGTIGFFHPDFLRDQPDRMQRIRLPRQKRPREESEPETTDLVQTMISLHARISHVETQISSQISSLSAKLDSLIAAWTACPATLRPQCAVSNPCAASAMATAAPLLHESPFATPPYGALCTQGMGSTGGLGSIADCRLVGSLAGALAGRSAGGSAGGSSGDSSGGLGSSARLLGRLGHGLSHRRPLTYCTASGAAACSDAHARRRCHRRRAEPGQPFRALVGQRPQPWHRQRSLQRCASRLEAYGCSGGGGSSARPTPRPPPFSRYGPLRLATLYWRVGQPLACRHGALVAAGRIHWLSWRPVTVLGRGDSSAVCQPIGSRLVGRVGVAW